MAVLFPATMRVTDNTGAPISGGKCRVRNINTTTLSSLYSDEAMATPLANPVIADANGWLPSIFVAQNTYDIAFLTSADVALSGQAWNDWPSFQASSSSTLVQELSGARFQVTGGDIGDTNIGARIEAGQPDPDNTGGYMRLGGWGGTQGDGLIVDFAAVNLSTADSFTEAGKRLPGVVYTEGSFSGVASVDIPLPNSPPNVRAWTIEIIDLTFASTSGTNLTSRISYDGSTYKSGATDYSWTLYHQDSAAQTITTDIADPAITFATPSLGFQASRCFLRIEVDTVVSGAGVTRWRSWLDYSDTSSNDEREMCFAAGRGGYGRAQAIRLLTSAVNFSGIYRVIPQRGFGE